MSGPMTGVMVVDLTTMISGPLATMMLADQGAQVIKVETPTGGDYSRLVATRRGGFSASFLNNNRNKRSVVLDLKQPQGLVALMRLLERADVMVQNFRPGVAERIGVGEAIVREHNPSIVYVSISGFGFTGPYAQKPVFDPLIQAVSGLTTLQAGSDEERPRLVRTILPDKLTGMQASQAISAALFARERSGKGQHVRLSMLDTLVAFLWSSDMGGHTFVGDEFEREDAQSFIDLIYQTRDGYVSIAVMQDKHWVGLARALGRQDFLSDPRFASAQLREENKDERLRLTQEAVQGLACAPLIARLEANDVPCAPVLTRTQMREHPQVQANETLLIYQHPHAGTLRQAAHPARFSDTPVDTPHGAPAYGADTRAVLAEAGFSEAELDELAGQGVLGPKVVQRD